MKKIIIGLSIFIVICFISLLCFFSFRKKQSTNDYKNVFIFDGKFSSVLITDFKSAKKSLNDIKENLGLIDIEDELKEDISNEYDGSKFYRFNQYYNGVRVYGNEVLVATNGSVADYLYSNTEVIPNSVNKDFKYSIDEVYDKITDKINNDIKEYDELEKKVEKIYYKKDNKYINAYLINVIDNSYLIDKTYIVSDDLEILDSYSNISLYSQNYFARTLDNQSVLIGVETNDGENFSLKDTQRNIKIIPYENTDVDEVIKSDEKIDSLVYKFTDNPDSYYVTIMNRISKVYDFYRNVLKFNGMDNRGGEIDFFVGVKIPKRSDNSCYLMLNNHRIIVLTDGYRNENSVFNNIPILFGHEYTHGVIQSINNLYSSNIPQGINEGYADVMGILSESYYQKEYNFTNRDRNPIQKDNNCDTCFYNTREIRDDVDSHSYATILSHALYLMTQGNNAINNIEKMAKLWYKSMYYLPSDANYKDVFDALVKSAKSSNFSDDEINKITTSLNAVGITGNTNFTYDKHEFCTRYRCGTIMEDGYLYFYDLSNNPTKPDKITVYTYVYSTDNLENKKEYQSIGNKFKITLPFNEVNIDDEGDKMSSTAYIIEIEYKDAVKKIYMNVCDKNNNEINSGCPNELNIYFEDINDKKEYDESRSDYVKQQLVCSISMNPNMFVSDKEIADAIKELTASITVEYNSNNTEIKDATLSMNFKIDLSSSKYSEIAKYTDETYFMDELRKEVKNNICGSNNYYYCDVIQKDNGFSVVASDSINNLINYNNSDQKRETVKSFIEKRGFKCN